MKLFEKKPKEQARRHETYHTQTRDVYDQSASKKTKRKTKASNWYVKWAPLWGFAGVYAAIALIVIAFHTVIANFMPVLIGKQLQLSTWQMVLLLWGKLSSTTFWFVFCLACAGAWGLWFILNKQYQTNNQDIDASDINNYEGDSEIQQPEDLPERYDIAPDAGAHYDVEVTAVLSHMDFSNKGLKHVDVTQRYDKTENGHFKGEAIVDDEGYIKTKSEPMIDTKFQQALFDASFVPDGKADDGKPIREIYDPNKINYNPNGSIRGKIKAKTVADLINKTWTFPEYELQRPAGAYVVDTDPNNTMVLAMTRAGKGQTIIEPTIDLWTRSNKPTNFLCNDPKGELYRKFYYPASKRGFEVLCFNLINDSRTNIFNPLDYAVEAARKGNYGKVSEYVKKIGSVFFPEVKGADPMWNNAANNTFIRSAIGLIDYYYEEERELRRHAIESGMSVAALDHQLDELWGHVTLYNVYQMMVQLAGKKSSDPKVIGLTQEEAQKGSDDNNSEEDEEAEEKDYLTLFFDATDKLPRNAIRDDVMNAHNAVNAMAGSDKTIASVYGIALTALSFFTDPKISRLTSGRPSQNFDMVGLAFPRRIEVRFDADYMKKYSLRDNRYRWTAYHDADMTEPYKDSVYENVINADGWLQYAIKPIFKEPRVYLKLEIIEDNTNQLMHRYMFEFTKGYQQSLSGRTFIKDPVSHERIVKDGTVKEMKLVKQYDADHRLKVDENGDPIYKLITGEQARTKIKKHYIDISRDGVCADDGDITGLDYKGLTNDRWVEKYEPAFAQVEVHYSERPKAIFVVTPPHMMEYAKLILIMIDQMFNMQVDSAYLTLPSQKPLYGTKYMLDEVGNLQSGGSGIPGLQTKESIGLGQSQQYTLILQTLQQLKDVYGDSIDKILQGNTGNIIYLKSTDDSMLSTLEQMSGITHESHIDSKSVTKDTKAVMNNTDSKTTHTISVKEKPVITKNDMLHIPQCNDMVFGKGDPIWSTNQTALPMAWRLHKDLVHDPAQPSYSLSNVPSTSNTNDFDRLQNQPDFFAMVEKRVKQARLAEDMTNRYRLLHGLEIHKVGKISAKPSDNQSLMLTDNEMSKIDHNQLANEIMDGINETLEHQKEHEVEAQVAEQKKQAEANGERFDENQARQAVQDNYQRNQGAEFAANSVDNDEVKQSQAEAQKVVDSRNNKIYDGGHLSAVDLDDPGYRNEFLQAFSACVRDFNNQPGDGLWLSGGDLVERASGKALIKDNTAQLENNENVDVMRENGARDDQNRAYMYPDDGDAFVEYLKSHPDWSTLGGGHWIEQFHKIQEANQNDMR